MTNQDAPGGVAPGLTAEQLLASVAGLARSGLVAECCDFRQAPGASLSIDDVYELAEAMSQRVRAGAAGVVVTQGTDTIEETAFLIDMLWPHDAPVVVTGAMRNPSLAGPDGPANLAAAIQAAASPAARGLGCVVVFAEEIHAARYVRKAHSTSIAAFASPSTGPIGHLVEGQARLLVRPARAPAISAALGMRPVRVGLVTMSLADDGELLRAVSGRFDGLVVAAFGAGHVPAATVPALGALAEQIPVELTTGRTFGVRLDPGEDFLPTLERFCRDNNIRQGYIPMFLAAFAEADIVGACDKLDDPDAPVWSKVHLTNAEALGAGTLAYDEPSG
jgi:L-asparaginase